MPFPDRARNHAGNPQQTQPDQPLSVHCDGYKLRNAVERAFCRIKDFRAVATRYDKLARNYLAGVCIVAALAFWIK